MAKIGDGTLAAHARLGLKELRNAFNPSRESVADSEIGMYGTMTQGEIASARNGAGDGPEEESLSLESLRGDAGKDQGQDRGKGRDRDDLER
jgi:hypothetical protein